jgi:hypothetical protein
MGIMNQSFPQYLVGLKPNHARIIINGNKY